MSDINNLPQSLTLGLGFIYGVNIKNKIGGVIYIKFKRTKNFLKPLTMSPDGSGDEKMETMKPVLVSSEMMRGGEISDSLKVRKIGKPIVRSGRIDKSK